MTFNDYSVYIHVQKIAIELVKQKKYFRLLYSGKFMLGTEVIMYSITILIEHTAVAVISRGKRCLLNLCDKRSPLIEIIYYSIAPRRWAA